MKLAEKPINLLEACQESYRYLYFDKDTVKSVLLISLVRKTGMSALLAQISS